MSKVLTGIAAVVMLLGSHSVVMAGDAAAGKTKSATCAACHGADGVSATDMFPNLKGQKAAYIVKQLKAFKDGSRKDPTMSPMAAPLADADMDDLAAYYSAQ